METTPRASTWTVEDIGTQLHSEDGDKNTEQHAAQHCASARRAEGSDQAYGAGHEGKSSSAGGNVSFVAHVGQIMTLQIDPQRNIHHISSCW